MTVDYGPFHVIFTDADPEVDGAYLPEYDPEVDGTPERYFRRADVQRALEVVARRRVDEATAYADWLASRTSPAQIPLPFPTAPTPRNPRYDPRPGDRALVCRYTGGVVWFAYCVSRTGDDLTVSITRPGWGLQYNDLVVSVEDWTNAVPRHATAWTSGDLSVTVVADG